MTSIYNKICAIREVFIRHNGDRIKDRSTSFYQGATKNEETFSRMLQTAKNSTSKRKTSGNLAYLYTGNCTEV